MTPMGKLAMLLHSLGVSNKVCAWIYTKRAKLYFWWTLS